MDQYKRELVEATGLLGKRGYAGGIIDIIEDKVIKVR